MAAVLKARDLELGRIVALKILPPEAARDPENVTRFKQEARAAAKLDHENIARVYFCGEDQGLHFIAFEFVEGDQPPAADRPPRPAPGRRVRPLHDPGRRRAAPRRRARRRPPRHQAVEHHHHARTAGPSSWTWAWPGTSDRQRSTAA